MILTVQEHQPLEDTKLTVDLRGPARAVAILWQKQAAWGGYTDFADGGSLERTFLSARFGILQHAINTLQGMQSQATPPRLQNLPAGPQIWSQQR